MRNLRAAWLRGVAAALCLSAPAGMPARAQPAPAPARVALVIGEGAYRVGPTPAAPDDAGLVAQVLAGAGFDVTAARDLDGDAMRRAFRDFLDRAGAVGPDGIAVVYFAGRAVQSDGDDYLVPVDARLARPADVPIEALRLTDFTHALAALPIQARVVVVDGAYAGGAGQGAPGLALVEAEPGSLLAFNATPGTVAPATDGPYGAYARAFVGAVKQGGVPVGEVFDRVRLAVDAASAGAEVPWDSDRLTRSFIFFDRAAGAPAVASAGVPFASLAKRPLRDFPPAEAFDVALARDTVPAYVEFLAAFPDDALARRVRLILAVRREALFWRAAAAGNTPAAYWTYLVRYPEGPHAADARRRLARLAAAVAPPPRFAPLAFDVPPPGPDEPPYGGPVVFVAPGLPPPPPPPVFLLPPLVEAPPPRPAPPAGPLLLPIPVPVAIPGVRSPAEPGLIAPPRGAANAYSHPRPYARGTNGDGLVVQTAPEPVPPPRPSPPTAPPPTAPPPSAPPAAGGPRAPTSLPAPPPRDLPEPMPPRPPAVVVPPIPQPVPPRPPESSPPPAPRPAPPPVPPRAVDRPQSRPTAPAPVEPPETPSRPLPPPASPERPPARPAPASPAPLQREPDEHPPAPPRTEPERPRPPEPARPEPRPERPAPPQREPGPDRASPDRPGPEHGGPDHPGARHPPGEARPACGHPGEPPCRP